MPIRWRWDQGRLSYFNFDNLQLIANVLSDLNGINLKGKDPLRTPLEQVTGLPFAPNNYNVWRNYARIFKWTLIAARIDSRLQTTDLCEKISGNANETWEIDEYLSFIIPRIYYPSPATQAYDIKQPQIFPVCAILKFLLALFKQRGNAFLGLETIFTFLIGNEVDGTEKIEDYLKLGRTNYAPKGSEKRQLRELLIFISQSSFLKWFDGKIYLDVTKNDIDAVERIESVANPILKERLPVPDAEVINLGAIQNKKIKMVASVDRENQNDLIFTEGKRKRVTHLRVERSPNLRKKYFESLSYPYYCDMCKSNVSQRYPWTDNLLEIHHILPLSSVIKISTGGTSLDDLVPLCPNCHKSTHEFYRVWLNNKKMDDFKSEDQALKVYKKAVRKINI